MYDEAGKRQRQKMRDFTALQWRRARATLRAMSRADQEQLLDYWNNHWGGPTAAEYFADLVDRWNRGEKPLLQGGLR